MSAAARRIMRLRCFIVDDAVRDHRAAVALHGEDHPAARAAYGRMLAHFNWAPQRGLNTPEAISWHRETGADPGYMNRTHRRHRAAQV